MAHRAVFEERKRCNSVVSSRVCKLKISGGNIDKGTRPLRVGEGNVRHKLLDHTETTDGRMRLSTENGEISIKGKATRKY